MDMVHPVATEALPGKPTGRPTAVWRRGPRESQRDAAGAGLIIGEVEQRKISFILSPITKFYVVVPLCSGSKDV